MITKSELKTGMVVIDNHNRQGVVLKNTSFGDIILWFYDDNIDEYISDSNYLMYFSEDLKKGDIEIVEVREADLVEDILDTDYINTDVPVISRRENKKSKSISIDELLKMFDTNSIEFTDEDGELIFRLGVTE